jgi:hypothetical protein
MIVGLADDVLLPVLVDVVPGPMPEPGGDRELVVRKVVRTQNAFRNHHPALAVEQNHAVEQILL